MNLPSSRWDKSSTANHAGRATMLVQAMPGPRQMPGRCKLLRTLVWSKWTKWTEHFGCFPKSLYGATGYALVRQQLVLLSAALNSFIFVPGPPGPPGPSQENQSLSRSRQEVRTRTTWTGPSAADGLTNLTMDLPGVPDDARCQTAVRHLFTFSD